MSLPPLTDRWMSELLGGPVPVEGRATCDQCVLCEDTAVDTPKVLATFNPRTKCCTYLPALANYQVGAVLLDPDMAEGRASLLSRIRQHVAVTPHGVGWPASFESLYDEDNDRDFGHRLEMRCPHYIDRDGGLCGVWRHRNGVCSTWFCRYERGEVGENFWREVQSLLEEIENALGWWCVQQLGIEGAPWELLQEVESSEGTLNGLTPVTPAAREAVWGQWFGHELAFFEACAKLVAPLSWAEVLEACGGAVRTKARELVYSLEDHQNTKLPPWVRLNEHEVAHEEDDSVWVYAYRAYDAVQVPRALLEAVEALGVTPIEEVQAAVADHLGRPVPDAEMRRWIDLGVLKADTPF